MSSPPPFLVWTPRVFLVLAPILLVIMLMIRRDWPALVGAGVFALLAEMALGTYDRFVLRGGPGFDDTQSVICALPMYSLGARSARSALVGFFAGYLGGAAAAKPTAIHSAGGNMLLFIAALALLMLDSAMLMYLRCLSPLRSGLVAVVGVVAGAVFQRAVHGAAQQQKCKIYRQ
jgi:hypothetical protein